MSENKYEFQKLTPTDDVDLSLYEDALDFVFDTPDIRNVAISGAYGAGKSSVLASYKKKHTERKFVHISLAHFEQPDKTQHKLNTDNNKDNDSSIDSQKQNKNESDTVYEVKESILEGKILNQLIHQIPAEKIPQTNFKVKKKSSTPRIVLNVTLIMLFALSLLHIFLFDAWSAFVTSLPDIWIKSALGISTDRIALIVSGVLCAVVLYIFLFWLIKAQKNRNVFRKVSFQGNEIEIFEESEESYFDKYLNEVLYLFESVEADVIVFEDMDRFNANRIFERLREVNTLANIQLKKENRSLIRFFYLLRDDIFVNKDRTKFFDYIVPVVPVVDSSNSYDQFISHFKKGGIFDLFEESFLQGLSLYVDEMRILKNIYNEFVIYYYRLNTTELDCNKMLAMITYKNLFPRDFNDLQLNRGFVYTLFASKDVFIQDEISKLNQKISQKREEIELAKNEHLLSNEELTLIYNHKRGTDYNGRLRPFKEEDQETYNKRKLALDNKLNDRCSSIEEEIDNIENLALQLRSKQLKDIISRSNIDNIFRVTTTNEIGHESNYNEIKGSDYFALLKFLIRNGYIDETYADYMTYFYENSLSRVDKTFLRSITDKKAKEYTYQLKKPLLVVSRLRLVDFDQEEILNFDLLEYLLQTPSNSDYVDRFLQQLEQTKNTKFIGAYFDTERERPAYIKNLNVQWPEFFSYALTNSVLSNTQIRLYSIFTLYYSSDDEVKKVNVSDALTHYISESADYLKISEPDIEKLIHGFILLGVSFSGIEPEQSNDELFVAVYSNALYKINFENISLMLRKFYSINDDDAIQHRNYSVVMADPESPLAAHIHENISQYMDVVVSSCNGEIRDDEIYALQLLNNEDVSAEQKTEYINCLITIITSLASIKEKELWPQLLNKRLAAYSIRNVVDYWKCDGSMGSVLVDFLNGDESSLDFSVVRDDYDKETAEKLFDSAVICNELSDDKYKEIVTSFGFTYDNFAVQGISDDKVLILIDQSIISMTADSLQFIRDNYPRQTMHYIEHNIDEYADILTSELFDFDEAMEALTWDIDDAIKINLLGYSTAPISIIDKNYTVIVCKHILENNLDSDDLPHLFSTYDSWPAEIQSNILNNASQNITVVTSAPDKVSRALLDTLFGSSQITDAQKIDLFVAALQDFDEDACTATLTTLGLLEYNKIFEPRSRPKFEVNATNNKLLTAFQDNGLIQGFDEDQEKAFYRITRIKPTSRTLPSELL
ncbi:hypothetical protein LJC49_01785 [Ruminococcaceae bacterium OttesenSCG-928-I18]|nr:hypothetical protein [Ruminococcaceae bacterium OttesenSCG-928-I18]